MFVCVGVYSEEAASQCNYFILNNDDVGYQGNAPEDCIVTDVVVCHIFCTVVLE